MSVFPLLFLQPAFPYLLMSRYFEDRTGSVFVRVYRNNLKPTVMLSFSKESILFCQVVTVISNWGSSLYNFTSLLVCLGARDETILCPIISVCTLKYTFLLECTFRIQTRMGGARGQGCHYFLL